MNVFRRFALLAVFATIGIGLAVGVAVSTHRTPPAAQESPAPLVVQTVTHNDEPAESRPESADRPLSNRIRPRPVVVLPSPPVANEFVPSPQAPEPPMPRAIEVASLPDASAAQAVDPQLERALEYLQKKMAAPQAAAAAAASEPASPTKPGAVPPPPSPSPAGAVPAGKSAPAAKGPSGPSNPPIIEPAAEGDGKLSIHLQNSDLREVLDMLSEQGGLNILASKEVQGKVSANLSNVDVQGALDAILQSNGFSCRRQGKFIFVGTAEEFNSMEQSMDRIGARVFRPNYVTSAELKTLITPLLTEKVGVVSVSTAAEAGIAASDATAGGDKYAGGDVVLVRDFEAVLEQIDQVVAEVDVRPLQVSIDATILSVQLKDENKFGIDFELLRNHMKFGWGAPATSLANFNIDGNGLKVGYLDGNIGAFLQALETIADTNVLAKPHLMVLNKHRAEILIGQKQGYVTTTQTQTSTVQAVDFLETGTQLRLRPFISRDGLIRMEVHPEESTGSVSVQSGFTLPNKDVTEVTTNIMVRDGCTLVIGGLIREQLANTTSAIPVLGSLPWIGAAFRTSDQTTQRRELIVLITPRIVYEPGVCHEGSKELSEFERRQNVYAEKMTPLNRRSIARRYFRLAQAAWAKCDRDTALRFAEMAVHFDPLSREAIDLRANIWQGTRVGEHTLDTPESAAPGTALVDGPEIAPWVLDDLKQDKPVVQAVPLHPFDPGQPGLHKDIERPRRLQ